MGFFEPNMDAEREERERKRSYIQATCGTLKSLLVPLMIISIITGILAAFPVSSCIAGIGAIAILVITIIYMVNVWKLGDRYSEQLKTAVILKIAGPIASVVAGILLGILSIGVSSGVFIAILEVIVSLGITGLGIYAFYCETDGFYYLFNQFDRVKANKWKDVFKFYLIAEVVPVAAAFVMIVFRIVGVEVFVFIINILSSVVSLVFSIISFVNQYQALGDGEYLRDTQND